MKWTLLIFAIGLLILLFVALLASRSRPHSQELSQNEFIGMVQSNLLAKVVVCYPAKLAQVRGVPVMLNEVRGSFYRTDSAGQVLKAQGAPEQRPFIARVHLTPELEDKLSRGPSFSFEAPPPLVQKIRQWLGRSN